MKSITGHHDRFFPYDGGKGPVQLKRGREKFQLFPIPGVIHSDRFEISRRYGLPPSDLPLVPQECK